MDLTVLSIWTSLFLKLLLLFSLFWVVSGQLFDVPYFCWISSHRIATCITASILTTALDNLVVYPYLRTPLLKFPSLSLGPINVNAMTFESPRGITALKWMLQYPDADAIFVRGGLGDSILLPVTPAAFRDILGAGTYDYEKQWSLRKTLARIIGFGLVLSEGNDHRKQRKALTPAFSIRNIKATYPLIWNKAQFFVTKLADEMKKQGVVEISSWSSKFTLDVIGEVLLSRDFKAMSTPNHKVAESFHHVLEPSLSLGIHFFLGFFLPDWFLKRLPIKSNQILETHCGFLRTTCEQILQEKKALIEKSPPLDPSKDGEEKRSVSDEGDIEEGDIMRDIIESNSFSDDEIVDQMLTFLFAGHETTASALTWCCYLLAKHKDIQERLRTEVRANIPLSTSRTSESVSYQTLESLPYLHGVCEETLRLYPTVPITIREVKRDTMVTGVKVPKGTDVFIVPYAVNRNPRFWGPDAAEMRPERWIDVSTDGVESLNKHGGAESNLNVMTFLHGNRSCMGRDFAKAELRCAIAAVFQRFEVSLWDPNEDVQWAGMVTVKPKNGMKLIFKEITEHA